MSPGQGLSQDLPQFSEQSICHSSTHTCTACHDTKTFSMFEKVICMTNASLGNENSFHSYTPGLGGGTDCTGSGAGLGGAEGLQDSSRTIQESSYVLFR